MREPRPITHIEISEKNKKLRMVLIIVLLVIGAVCLTSGFMSLLRQDTGWQTVEVSISEPNCSGSFLFQYNFSGSGVQATALNKQIEATYTDGVVKAYQVFHATEVFQGNLAYLNTHVNEVVTVDPLLYGVLEKLHNTRYHYLGPVYAHYDNMIFGVPDEYLQDVDPAVDEESRAYLAQIAAFAADEQAIRLELLGASKVKLWVSEEYLAFARENEITRFVDLNYMTNAFIIDYLAEILLQDGFNRGYLVSTDGYTRNLDSTETFSFTIFDRVDHTVYPAGVMQYRGPVSMVFLKDFQTSASDVHYRQSGDHLVFPYADPADGMYKASVPNLVGYSYELGCTDVLLRMLPSFIGEEFTLPQGICSIWCEDQTICYNDAEITITQLLNDGTVQYTAQRK